MICQDYTVSQESFAIVECKKCHFKFTNPRPSERNVGKYYQSEAYISHSNSKKGWINRAYHLVRMYTLRQKLSLINSLVKNNKTILDIGCGTGMFLKICKQNGWQVAGVEPDPGARNQAKELVQSSVEEDILLAYDGKVFDVITMWHVLEHVHELEKVIIKLQKLLAPEGTIVVAVPNCESLDAKIYQEKWAAYDVPRHLYHFSPNSIKTLFKKYKLKVKETLPMKLDAFYVSLLSTQYKEGKTNYVEALKTGYASNKWAKHNGNNYSSLIYLIQP
jgi:SAM-dependent methyltransferase